MIKIGDTVRIISKGVFQGQEVKVVKIERDRARKDWYKLEANWEEKPYPAWFEAHEIEPVEATC